MSYSVKYKKSAEKKLARLDAPIRKRIKDWIEKNLVDCENPRQWGKPLEGEWYGYWRYRVGNYRLVAKILEDEIIFLIVNEEGNYDIYK